MMKRSHTLIAGSALILLTNAVALLGVAYNRSGDPESQLQLTQRELQHSTWHSSKDNSGITLRLNWRFEQADINDSSFGMYTSRWGMPVWLGKVKMAELGFNVDKLASTAEHERRYEEALPREALLVLELNDKAYQHQLQRSNGYVEQIQKLLAENPDSEEFKRRAKNAEENHLYEQNKGSRLFVIDAGLDLQTLRAAYPDHSRHAIVHGLIRPSVVREKNETRIGGYIDELHAEHINVPLAHRQAFNDPASYEVTLAFGKRFEPWIITASRGAVMNESVGNK